MYMQGDLVLCWFNYKFDRKSAHLIAHWITLLPDQLMLTGAKVAQNLHTLKHMGNCGIAHLHI